MSVETSGEVATAWAAGPMTLVLHAHWSGEALHLWAEQVERWAELASSDESTEETRSHPYAADAASVTGMVGAVCPGVELGQCILTLKIPRAGAHPQPSPHLAHLAGHTATGLSAGTRMALGRFEVPTAVVRAADALGVLEGIDDATGNDRGAWPGARSDSDRRPAGAADSVRFLAAAGRFVRHLLAQQRFVPMAAQGPGGAMRGLWQLWLGDDATVRRLERLMSGMPASVRAAEDAFGHDGWAMLESFLHSTADAVGRGVLVRDNMIEAIEGRDPVSDPHVAWLSGLLADDSAVADAVGPRASGELAKGIRQWIGGLEERPSGGGAWRLLLKLGEPVDLEGIDDLATPGEGVHWPLSLCLQSTENPLVTVAAEEIWALPSGAANVGNLRIETPQELMLGELGRAARVYRTLEKALGEAEPTELSLSTSEAYRFLREIKPILSEQGFGVEAPAWWDMPTIRLGARLQVSSEEVDWTSPASNRSGSTTTRLGLSSLVSYRWQMAVGDTSLTLEQFEQLAAQHSPLVRLNGRWVEIRPEDVRAAVRFIKENPGGKIEVGRALRLAYASDAKETGLPILGMDATGWVATVFGDASQNQRLPMLSPPTGFVGTLRPYQLKGLSWLAFLDRLGLGSCLADDMGLGKTIQLLALLANEREQAAKGPAEAVEGVGPTLLVVPMSVVANWVHESRRFTPTLRVLVHHGAGRLSGQRLLDTAATSDMVITTYALAHRDRDQLSRIGWERVVLDEAQNIKNPGAKQTRAVHEIDAPRRIALTGTPVENRLGELWSIMDFLNPGYLGTAGEFRRKFSLPIERYHEKHKGQQLRGLVQPFVLRRLKSDPAVITDLPEKVESKEYCYLTPEQAGLYQTVVGDMLSAADKVEGIQRRGIVLAGLIKLKQVCNHPAHFLKEAAEPEDDERGPVGSVPVPSRSGKCQRLVEMLEEVVAAGDKALVFTQFRKMGDLLAAMLRKALDREVLFLHGGSPAAARQAMIEEFQGGVSRDKKRRESGATAPVFILSLKAGGVGLNLTAANHVFHFDRWWNPAVEAQATDRAYRIGQTRTVQVHKFVVSGTLEERIDQMIEEKVQLADQVIGAGEEWLTELSSAQLRDMLTLRSEAVADSEIME